ncbi:MAG: glycosyltransferase family 9 protein [Wenyingzhuangia sp.]|uniref:glycosyltransferase family 9 protein n=1 Tax=Wenyingzhuangia sp. TaxID=1964193 RepID=UPI003219E85F
MQNIKHLLVIRLSAMGDVAMTVPVIKTLTDQNPELKLTIVSKSFLKPLFDDLDQVTFFAVDVKTKHKGLQGIYKLYKELRPLKFDGVADLHNVLRSKILRFFFRLEGIEVCFINKGRSEKKALTARKNKKFKRLISTHQRYSEVFKRLGIPIDLKTPSFKEKKEITENLKDLIQYQPNEKMIGIAPFAAHESKKYPLKLMEEVVNKLSKQHKILLFGGGQQEIHLLNTLEEKNQNVFSVAGKIKLKDELIIISQLSAMVSMDSGNGHFSALFGVPTITLWGATHPYAGFAPFGQEMNGLTADREQYPLLPTSIYGNKTIPGYEKAMETISPKTVINKVLSTIA